MSSLMSQGEYTMKPMLLAIFAITLSAVTVLRAHEIVSVGPVTAEHLVGVFDRLRGGAMLLRATS